MEPRVFLCSKRASGWKTSKSRNNRRKNVERDQNKNKRIDVRCTLMTTVRNGAEGQILGRGRDLSLSGIGLMSQRSLATGSRLDLVISLILDSGVVAVRAQGEVRHCVLVASVGLYRVGVRFVALEESSKKLIETYVRQRQKSLGKAAEAPKEPSPQAPKEPSPQAD